ncbi:MAG: DNA polymerase III subunit chi [Gammaproteobacteria bacterium]|nr:DNA polymerase III subunit chi [Gammaproteobacteria bacterium]MDH5592909.1 DNA polymerase III subunit chi [Gammaproteobacteria bacterium]MDH5614147.1 DNA polymerase III subunit chi [Gammaproteobacteria bacterium]
MTKVDFYITENKQPAARFNLACRLAEKIHELGHRIYIHTDDESQSQAIDDLLWTFKQNSFLPHCIATTESDIEEHSILIGHNPSNENEDDVLINLSQEVPAFFSRFHRVVELIDQDENHRQLGRGRFKFYKERGYPLESHSIKA